MTTLSKERREWLYKMFPRDAAAMIREIENLPTEAEANKMVTRLKDAINAEFSRRGRSPSEHPGIGYFGQAFKSTGSQRPERSSQSASTFADIQQMQKNLSTRIKAYSRAQKDAQQAAETETVLAMLALADRLELNQDAVMKLVAQYGLDEVMSILRTLTNQKEAKGAYYSPFYGCQMKTVDIADVRLFAHQHAEKQMKNNPDDTFFR